MTDPVDLSRNRELALRARLSVAHPQAQALMQNWLIGNHSTQQEADRAVRVVEICAQLRGTDMNAVGDLDTVAHCLAWTLVHNEDDWLVEHSGFLADPSEPLYATLQRVFGLKFVEEPFVERFDNYGEAMIVGAAEY